MRRRYLEMLPMSFKAVHSFPGIENEKDIPGNAFYVIQCSSLNSRYKKNKTGNASHIIQ